MSASKLILVTGDPICDNNYYAGDRDNPDSTQRRGFQTRQTGGGALLLKDLIEATIHHKQQTPIDPKQAPIDLQDWAAEFGLDVNFHTLPSEYHAYCLWKPHLRDPQADKKEEEAAQARVWRTAEPLGYGHPAATPAGSAESAALSNSLQPPIGRFKLSSKAPDIVVIDDAGLRFRHSSSKDRWPFAGMEQGQFPQWIVLKWTGAIQANDLFDKITSFSETEIVSNLVVIVSADLIRRNEVRLSRGLSWEATVEDIAAELKTNPILAPLLRARHLIITFRSDAAFWLNHRADASSLLVFDAENAEGDWEARQGEGDAFGYISCFTTAVVRTLCGTQADQDPDLETALMAGLGASRELRVLGHGEVGDPTLTVPGFPFGAIAARIAEPPTKFVSVQLPNSLAKDSGWMMLDEWHYYGRTSACLLPHREVARAVAELGPAALERFPVARFGGLQTVDRNEIESLRTLRNLIQGYKKGDLQERPLNLGVFGPPGAGKSYGVTQIALSVLEIVKKDILTFNLSQFSDVGDLIGAFHRIRDEALTGKTPLVFWDEFDSQGYRWLQYLLAPMQDGVFQQGQATHPIGKCVFVFAGATSPTFDTFGPLNPHDLSGLLPEEQREVEAKWLDFALKKGPDFKSRIVGFLNVLGPNPRQKCEIIKGRRLWTDDESDVCYPIRRALFLRSQFQVKDGVHLEMDSGVLRALIETPRYKSGSRSLEFLCGHLKAQSAGLPPRRSHLPGRQLLDMHVDADTFWEICERDQKFQAMAHQLAAFLHKGYRLKIKNDPKRKDLDVAYNKLQPDKQHANLFQALRIPQILALAGLQLVPGKPIPAAELVAARGAEYDGDIRRILHDPSTLELLAEAEHNGWMVERMLVDVKYGRITDLERKRYHNLLIPYIQLSEADKDRDRHTIIGHPAADGKPERFGYIDLVKIAGWRIAKMPKPPRTPQRSTSRPPDGKHR